MASSVLIQGFFTGLSLIVAIGAQNAYVLKQGLKKEHIFAIALICSLIDAILIVAGVKGVGILIAKSQLFLNIITLFGILFLLGYGLLSLKNAFLNKSLRVQSEYKKTPLKKTLFTTFSLTLLNPHVYLDTCLLVGSIGGAYESKLENFFIAGAISASFIWFFGLGYGARVLRPLFEKPKTWMILDIIIACIMFFIAFGLFIRLYQI